MHSSPEVSPTPQWLTLARLVAAAFGLYHGYLVGAQIGGLPFGIVMAANGAAFCALGVSALAEHTLRWWRPNGRPPSS